MNTTSELIQHFPDIEDGITKSELDGVIFFKETQHIPRKPLVYSPGICIILQGHKVAWFGDRKIEYDATQYLVTSVTIPMECETFGSREEPLCGIYIDIDLAQLRDIIGQMDIPHTTAASDQKQVSAGTGPAPMCKELQDAVRRLLICLQSSSEAQILGPGLLREILYRVLQGEQSQILYSLARHDGTFSQISRALKFLENNYAQKLNVGELAQTAHLSVSAFHRAFKEITSDSPMQYLKKLRLSRAKDLIIQERMKAYRAAYEVGYESASQFSREFKRYFGHSPADIMRELRTA